VTGAQPTAGAPEPSINERLEGQRSWLAQLDRRVGVRTYAGAAAVVIALAAAAVALVLVLQLDDESAKTADIDQLREEIAGVEDTATEAAQEDVQSMTERITQLESDIAELGSTQDSTDQKISVVEDDIQDLRDQIADLDQDSASGSGGASSP
jgi:septal ring factor EnvC (AmiA/AmiB activator)